MKTNETEFTADEIFKMRDVELSNERLAREFEKPSEAIRKYRLKYLGMALCGSTYEFETLRHNINWDMPTVQIAMVLKVSPDTVRRWRSLASERLAKPRPEDDLTPDEIAEIRGSRQPYRFTALKYGISIAAIRRIKCGCSERARRGRPRAERSQFPNVDWSAPAKEIAKATGLSFTTAKRLKDAG